VLDILDGRIARLTNTTSEFGAQLDSLADVISFGVAPAVLVYSWGLSAIPRAGWLAAFLFVMCGTLRLARFNVQKHVVDGRHFVGMPIPAAAGQVAAIVFFVSSPPEQRLPAILLSAIVVVLAFLMVSTFRYPSFKGVDLRSRRSYINVLGIALLFLLVAIHPEWVILCGSSLYTLSAPAVRMASFFRRRSGPPPPVVAADPAV